MKPVRNLLFCAALLGVSAPSSASAVCSRERIPGPNSHIYNALGEPFLLTYDPLHRALYDIRRDRGWDESRGIHVPLLGTHEYQKHMLGTLLVQFGVAGTPPSIRRTGTWPLYRYEYDHDAIRFSPVFHRSKDEWGPLSLAGKYKACTGIDWMTGEQSCSESTDFGHQTVTGVDDVHPVDPGTIAWHHSIWDLFKDPDWEIEYFCGALDNVFLGAVGTATAIVHENWHATRAPNHVGDQQSEDGKERGGAEACTQNDAPGRCDTFVTRAPSGRKYAHLAELQFMGVGAYQIEHRFICDLTEGPADWIPVILHKVIAEHAYRFSRISRFTNMWPDGYPPFTCGAPRDELARSSSGCPGGRSCTSAIWCASTQMCQDGCCVAAPR